MAQHPKPLQARLQRRDSFSESAHKDVRFWILQTETVNTTSNRLLIAAIRDDCKRNTYMQTRVERLPNTKKRMVWMIVGVLVLIAIIAGVKVLLVMRMIASFPKPAPATVSVAKAEYQVWQPQISAVGTLRAMRGADLALDVSGLVESVNLKSGDDVKKGQVLLQLRDADDRAKLASLQATAKLAALTANRS